MPRIVHVVESPYSASFRSAKVAGMFDIPATEKLRERWDINIPVEEKPWQVGLIVGASGSGKTTLARELARHINADFHAGFSWTAPCLLDDFPADCDMKSLTETLSKVGFSSPPSWLLPYGVLSNGQKFRVELARCLFEYQKAFVFDEFTSVVDRQVAQVSAYAFAKAIRRTKRQFIAVTCHYDVEAWLQPDWVLDVSANSFKWGSLRRPPLNLEIARVHYSAWELFKKYHYLDGSINKSAACYVAFLDGRPVAFDAWISFFGKLQSGRRAMRDHRRVVLPDYQGLGIGNRLLTELSRMWTALGYRAFLRTGHPAEIKKQIESPDWCVKNQGHASGSVHKRGSTGRVIKHSYGRLTSGSEFIGAPMPLDEARKLYGG